MSALNGPVVGPSGPRIRAAQNRVRGLEGMIRVESGGLQRVGFAFGVKEWCFVTDHAP